MAEITNSFGIRSWTCQSHISMAEGSTDFQVETWLLNCLREARGLLRCRGDLDPISREIQAEVVGSDFGCGHLEGEAGWGDYEKKQF